MSPRVVVLILSSLVTLNAKDFANVVFDPVGLTNIALNSDASEVFFGARRMTDGTAENGINLYRVTTATGLVTKLTNYIPEAEHNSPTHLEIPKRPPKKRSISSTSLQVRIVLRWPPGLRQTVKTLYAVG